MYLIISAELKSYKKSTFCIIESYLENRKGGSYLKTNSMKH